MNDMSIQVEGLNCGGCVTSLSKRLLAVPGVTGVSVDLVPGGTSTALVTTLGEVPRADLEAAVVAAGKRPLASPASVG